MLLRHSKKICLIDSALRWCSDIPVEKSISDRTRDSCLEDCMDSFIDAHLYFLPLPRFARAYDTTSASDFTKSIKGLDQESIIYKAALLTSFASELSLESKDTTTVSLFKINELFLEHYPSLDCLRDSRIDLSFQACLLCLLALDAKSLKNLNVKKMTNNQRNTFTHLAFKEIKKDVGSFNTYIEMLQEVSRFLRAKQESEKALQESKETKDSSITEAISKEPEAYKAKEELKDVIETCSVRPTESWSNIKHLKSRGILLAEIEALALSKINNDADETYGAEQLWNSLYVSNIVEESPDFAYKINLKWTTKTLGQWSFL